MESDFEAQPEPRWVSGVNLTMLRWGLEELASKDDQIILWANIGNEKGLMSSFVEACCTTFDDSAYSDGRAGIVRQFPDLCDAMDRLDAALDACDNRAAPLDLIESREMEIVRQAATDALRALP